MVKYKVAVRWSDGTYEGISVEGATEDIAKDDAFKLIYKKAAKKGQAFAIIKFLDVYQLPKDVQQKIKLDWERDGNFSLSLSNLYP